MSDDAVHQTTIDITSKLAFWNTRERRSGGMICDVVRCGPIIARHADGSVTVSLGTAFDSPTCPREEKGKWLCLAKEQWRPAE